MFHIGAPNRLFSMFPHISTLSRIFTSQQLHCAFIFFVMVTEDLVAHFNNFRIQKQFSHHQQNTGSKIYKTVNHVISDPQDAISLVQNIKDKKGRRGEGARGRIRYFPPFPLPQRCSVPWLNQVQC